MKTWLQIVGLSALFLSCSAKGWSENNFDNIPQLVVKGEASLYKPADQIEVVLGVATIGDTSAAAYKENTLRMQQIVANLIGVGLSESDYQTGRFRAEPIYYQPSKDGKEDKQGKISHYEVINTIHIKTQKIDLANEIIDAAVKGGANRVDQVSFNLNNPQAYREEAIQMAASNALSNARALAAATGVRLVKVLYLSLDHWQHRPMPFMAKMAGSGGNEAPLETGNVEVQATVNLIYQIAPM